MSSREGCKFGAAEGRVPKAHPRATGIAHFPVPAQAQSKRLDPCGAINRQRQNRVARFRTCAFQTMNLCSDEFCETVFCNAKQKLGGCFAGIARIAETAQGNSDPIGRRCRAV
ncbi:hypothetical protein A8B82_02940 [Sulfitobacter sp. EhC04]|nr:hypothetical protein A8B82_02940 [Sulfitobacter sp. EhC04]